jgi:hypothetical protein
VNPWIINSAHSANTPLLLSARPGVGPGGAAENSPAFQCRVSGSEGSRPEGTVERLGSGVRLVRVFQPRKPSGDAGAVGAGPGVETPGYSQLSLRDKAAPRPHPRKSPRVPKRLPPSDANERKPTNRTRSTQFRRLPSLFVAFVCFGCHPLPHWTGEPRTLNRGKDANGSARKEPLFSRLTPVQKIHRMVFYGAIA